MKKKTSNVKGTPAVAVQRVVRRLLHIWKFRRKKYKEQESNLREQGLLKMAHTAWINQTMCDAFINDLEWELPPGEKAQP